jgi:hypothetical protein
VSTQHISRSPIGTPDDVGKKRGGGRKGDSPGVQYESHRLKLAEMGAEGRSDNEAQGALTEPR